EQRYAIRFCVRLGKNATETFQMLQEAFKDCISRSQFGRWHKAFKEGREEVADGPPTTARTDENVNRMCEVLPSDRRLSIQYIADTINMSTFAVHGIVTENLQMRRVCAKLVPKVLTEDQKELRVWRCQEFNTPVVPQPLYSPDLAPCDFFLFPRLKRELKGKHWESMENIQKHVTTFLRDIPVEEFQRAFQAWQTRLRKCIESGGEYFKEF
ncbi:FLJ37770-like protein, partial [Acromyrmex echinatior]